MEELDVVAGVGFVDGGDVGGVGVEVGEPFFFMLGVPVGLGGGGM